MTEKIITNLKENKSENDYDLIGDKNAIVWCAIECYAYDELIEQTIREQVV